MSKKLVNFHVKVDGVRVAGTSGPAERRDALLAQANDYATGYAIDGDYAEVHEEGVGLLFGLRPIGAL